MNSWTTSFIDTNGVHLHYHRTGGKHPAMILLHGATDNGLCWTSLAKDLQADYDVIMPDARGHGKSAVTAMGSSFSIHDMAEDTVGLATQLGLDHPVLVGHSMGGLVATIVASQYPDLPSRLVLEDPAFIIGKGLRLLVPLLRRLFMRSIKRMGKMSIEEGRADIKKHNPAWNGEEIEAMAIAHHEFVRNASIEYIKEFDVLADWENEFPRITCPVLFLIPSNGFLRLNVAKKLLPLFKDARIGYIPGASHGVHRDQYTKSLETIKDFLA